MDNLDGLKDDIIDHGRIRHDVFVAELVMSFREDLRGPSVTSCEEEPLCEYLHWRRGWSYAEGPECESKVYGNSLAVRQDSRVP